MNIEKLKEELTIDEGCKYEIYKDHLGYPTFGIGHLVLNTDPEYGLEIGAQVIDERVHEVFEKDIAVVIADCKIEYVFFNDLPEEVQHIVANMMFNMGRPRLSKFKGMKAGVDARDWNRAADEMVESRWHDQVPNRAKRLVKRMRALSDG